MDKKTINKEIRKISNYGSLPLLCYFVLYILLMVGANLLVSALYYNGINVDEGLFTLIAYVVLYLGIVPLSMLVFYKLRGKKTGQTLKACFKKPEKSAGWIAKWLLISVAVIYFASFLSNMLFTIIQSLTGFSLVAKEVQATDSVFGIIAIVLAIPVFAPIFEELLFRGTFCRNAEPLGQWFAAIMTGVVFGLWHLNYTQFLFAVVMGIFSCLLLIKTKSIIPSVLMHFIINLIGTVQTLCKMNIDMDKFSSADFSYIFSHMGPIMIVGLMGFLIFALIAAGVVLFIVELVRHRGKANLRRCVYQIKPLKKLAVYFSAPITIIVFVFMIVITVLNAIGIVVM